jgi:hypothetical protein
MLGQPVTSVLSGGGEKTDFVGKIFAVIFLSLASFLSVVVYLAVVDPVGTKMADDPDPFGSPMPWHSHLFGMFLIIVLMLSAYLLWRP